MLRGQNWLHVLEVSVLAEMNTLVIHVILVQLLLLTILMVFVKVFQQKVFMK